MVIDVFALKTTGVYLLPIKRINDTLFLVYVCLLFLKLIKEAFYNCTIGNWRERDNAERATTFELSIIPENWNDDNELLPEQN